ncbi:MAG: MFS transporter [Gemmatimonadetes bacterium]|nr:MFS transporter [Gemmatimonadota bacterium]MDA1103272.1 MFS transporter [Gemmatimonadota bacterium]
MDKKQVGAWVLFDFANSVYPAVMTTAVFPLVYVQSIVADDAGRGDFLWGLGLSVSAFIVATSAPLLGAIADRGGARKKFMMAYTALCLIGVALISTIEVGMAVRGILLFIVANVGFESAVVFYNAYLPDIVPADKRGQVSGLGFGVGYLGSALGLILALQFVDTIEVVWLIVAAFFFVFSIPAFLYLPADEKGEMSVAAAARWGLTNFKVIVGEVWALKDLRNFLFSFFFYIDGVLTIIAMAGVVAAGTFGFSQSETIVLFLIVQFSALFGAFALAKPADRWGPKKILNGVLLLWITAGISAFFIQDRSIFFGLAVVAGFGLGSVQSSSRAFMASLIPDGKESEMFGFYALCGKSSSMVGPLLFGTAAALAGGNQRPGFLVLTALFVIGLILLQRVRDPRAPVTA